MNARARKQRLVADINITPFTDVILVLLVIFMITTPLIYQSNIKVSLPQAKSGESEENRQQVKADITITGEGVVYLNDKIVTRKELREQIRMMHNRVPDLGVTVHSDKFVRFQEIVNVLDPLNELGISNLNIAVANEQ